MKTLLYKLGIIIAFTLAAAGLVRCGHGHKREERKIRENRLEQSRETADVGEAVKATDEAGWDSVAAQRQFRDTARDHLNRSSQALDVFTQKITQGRKKVPLAYRRRLKRLKERVGDLEQKLMQAPAGGGQAAWEDYVRLYNYDMQRLEHDVHRLTGYKQ